MNVGLRVSSRPATRHHGFLASILDRLAHFVVRSLGLARHDRLVVEEVRGQQLLVMPNVFNPRRMRTGSFFASVVDSGLSNGLSVLDMGTGTGICAIAAARLARRVIALDINPSAVRCAKANVLIHCLEDKIDVRHGDLFAAVVDERFDLVLFNPPFLYGVPKDDYDRAWRATDVAERFAFGLRAQLSEKGFALLLLSTFGDAAHYLDPVKSAGFQCTPFATRRYFNETVTIYKVAPSVTRPGS